MITVWGLQLLALIYTVAACMFPSGMRGRWYQSRYGELEISHNEITKKGTCDQKEDNKYLLYNRNRNCYTCVVISMWHENILQYKESYCYVESDINTICNRIHGEAQLHTVVRVPSKPVTCPFQGYYSFIYSNSTTHNRQCSSPLSEIRACADDSKFKFVYRKCPGMPETSDKELDFQCLATWENGEKFLYGRFRSQQLHDREQEYRCFMHNFFGISGFMSISADATCQGLQSPAVGVSTMKLDKDPYDYRWPLQRCTFSKFFIHRKKWRDLSGQYELEVESQMFRIKDTHARDNNIFDEENYTSDTWLMLRCINEAGNPDDAHVQQYVVHSTDNTCTSNYRCVRLTMRHSQVVELQIGEAREDEYDICNDDRFNPGLNFLLIEKRRHTRSTSCPQPGSFKFTDMATECQGQFNSGCRVNDEIEIQHFCPRTNRRSVDIFQCLVSWEEGRSNFVIAHHPGSSRNEAKCLVYVETPDGIDVHEDELCRNTLSATNTRRINYSLLKPADECSTYLPPAVPSGITSDRNIGASGNSDTVSGVIIDAGTNGSPRHTITSYLLLTSLCALLYIHR